MSDFILNTLKANKKRFTAKQMDVLKAVALNPKGFDYRKNYESKSGNIYYLPANKQAVENKLNLIGLTLASVPANDGSKRKLYSLRPIKLVAGMERCAKCGFVQLLDDFFHGGCVACGFNERVFS